MMNKNKFIPITFFVLNIFFILSLADEIILEPMNRQLSEYIAKGLSNNLAIKQALAQLQTAKASVKESRAKFFPTLNFSSRYTRADGGRSIRVPVGDIMLQSEAAPLSPQKLNELNKTRVTVVPSRDQETKLQLSQPLFAPEIVVNYRMHTRLYKSNVAEFERTQLNVVRDIRNAYYTCLQAKEAILVQSASCKRTASQLHTAKKLFKAGILTRTAVLVAEAAYSKSRTDSNKSCSNLENACQAFNVILNRPIDAPVTLVTPNSEEFMRVIPDDTLEKTNYSDAASKRREIIQLLHASDALRLNESLEKCSFTPKLLAGFEGGIVGESYEVTHENKYFTTSLILQWEIFSGLSRKQKVRKAILAQKSMKAKISETRSNILLQINRISNAHKIAVRRCRDNEKQLKAARKNYHEVLKRFEQGGASTQELVDAQSFLTGADAGVLVSRYDVFRQWSELRNAVGADTAYISHTPPKGL